MSYHFVSYRYGTCILSAIEVLSSTSLVIFNFFWVCVLIVWHVIERYVKYVWVTDISEMNDFLIVLQVLKVLDVCEKLYQFWFKIWGIFLGENNGSPFSDFSNSFLIRFQAFFSWQESRVSLYELKGGSDYRWMKSYWNEYKEKKYDSDCGCEKSVELDHFGS